MKTERMVEREWLLFATRLSLLAFWVSAATVIARADTSVCTAKQGYNAVYGTCPGKGLQVVGSQAIIDARAWCGTSCDTVDFCRMVADAIAALPAGVGGVVDARGVVHSDGTAIPCTLNPFPQPPNNVPVTVLLPPGTIQPQVPWILPSNTRISGQSSGRTVLQPTGTPNFAADSTNSIIEMGASAGSTGVVVEHLQLDGGVQAGCTQPCIGVGGIYNGNAQDGSYVNDVSLYRMGALTSTQSPRTTGLLVDAGAAGSGPYTNIAFYGPKSKSCNNNTVTCQPTAAVQIRAATRGLHGITATTRSIQSDLTDQPLAAIYLDASNNTIEDAHFEGFYDGIVVGANVNGLNATVAGNTIANVNGGNGGSSSGPTFNTVHACNRQIQTGACSNNSVSAKDLNILDAASDGGGSVQTATVQDDLTGTTINSSTSAAYTAMYMLGEPLGTSQYSRFTTSLGSMNGSSGIVPTWAVGSTALTNQSCATPGALYSNTNGSGSGNNSNTLYLCAGGSWLPITNQ